MNSTSTRPPNLSQDIDEQLNKLLESHKQLNEESQRNLRVEVEGMPCSWEATADRIEHQFELVRDKAKQLAWFENLYVDRPEGLRSIQLFYGKHPVPGTNGQDMERGASLVISQSSIGSVVVLLYPFQSKALKRIKPRLIWGMYNGPEELTDKLLLKIIGDFLTYARVSSVYFSSSAKEEKRVARLETKSRLIEGTQGGMRLWRETIVALIVGSLITAGIFIAWILDDNKGWLEPWAGLSTLITGWIAVRVQQGKDAINHAIASEEAEKADKAHEARLKKDT